MTARSVFIITLLGILVALLPGVVAAQDLVRLRFIHAAPDLPALTVYVNGELAVDDLAFGATSSHLRAPGGQLRLTVWDSRARSMLFGETLKLDSDAALVFMPGDRVVVVAVADDLSAVEAGMARLTVVNAYEDGIILGSFSRPSQPTVGEALGMGDAAGPFVISADKLELAFLPAAGGAERSMDEFTVALGAGASHILVLRREGAEPALLVSSAATDGVEPSSRVNFVHALQGAAPVDLRLGETLIAPSLAIGTASGHIAQRAGAHRLSLSLGAAELAVMELELDAGLMRTVVVFGSPGSLRVAAFDDDASQLDAETAVLRLVNAIPGGTVERLGLEGGALIASQLDFGSAGESVAIEPGKHALSLRLTIGDETGVIQVPARRFYGGAFYNLIALSGGTFSAPRLMIIESSLAREITSTFAPPLESQADATDATLEGAAPRETEAPPATSTPVEIIPTPTEPSIEEASEPTAAPAPDDAPTHSRSRYRGVAPHAIVDLDPDARLQLRQYPSRDALSLGLLAGGSELMVVGRRGPSVYHEGELPDEPVDLSDVQADPAAALHPGIDLPARETWLYVRYETPDGGALFGWVNAYYLQAYDAWGEAQTLRRLKLVRQNQAGSAVNTAIRPPNLADSVRARVVRLDSAARLNIRMANDATSEVLGSLPPGATLKLLGMDAELAWAMVEYEAESTITRGWASANFLQPLLNDRPVTIAALRALDPTVVPTLGEFSRGSVRPMAAAAERPAPTPASITSGIVGEIALDPGAKLHLRRYPDAQSESLGLIESGAMVAIDGVTESGGWLKTSYRDEAGWVAALYVRLLLRGRVYARDFVLSRLPVYDDRGFAPVLGASG